MAGSSRYGAKLGRSQLNMSFSEPARLSKEELPVRWPPSQLSSMNARIEVWSAVVPLDVVGLGVGRDEQERQPLAVAAPVLVAAERGAVPADAGGVERVGDQVAEGR